jgi:hypothetical protein
MCAVGLQSGASKRQAWRKSKGSSGIALAWLSPPTVPFLRALRCPKKKREGGGMTEETRGF